MQEYQIVHYLSTCDNWDNCHHCGFVTGHQTESLISERYSYSKAEGITNRTAISSVNLNSDGQLEKD